MPSLERADAVILDAALVVDELGLLALQVVGELGDAGLEFDDGVDRGLLGGPGRIVVGQEVSIAV